MITAHDPPSEPWALYVKNPLKCEFANSHFFIFYMNDHIMPKPPKVSQPPCRSRL